MRKWLPIAGILAALAGVIAGLRRRRQRDHAVWSTYTNSV